MRLRSRDDRDWREAEFVAVDFELTGADPRRAAPVSVGWVVVRDGRVHLATGGYRVIRHNGDVPVESMRIHRLLPGDVAEGAPPGEVAALLRRATDGRLVVAHGAWMEREVLRRLGVERRPLVCTLAATRRLRVREGQRPASRSLTVTARDFGVPPLRAHHAFGDALTTALLLLAIAARIERERGRCLVDDLVKLGRTSMRAA